MADLTSVGRLLVNAALPEEHQDTQRLLDKKGLDNLLQAVAKNNPDKYREISHKLLQIGSDAAFTTGSNSFGLRHLRKSQLVRATQHALKSRLQAIRADSALSDDDKDKATITELQKAMPEQANAIYDEGLANDDPLALQVLSGARGNKTNLSTLRGSDLLYVDHRERPIPIPVLRSYSEGLRPEEYWAGAYGARKGLVDVKQGTGKAGYLSKQLLQTTHRLLVTAEDEEDDAQSVATGRGLPSSTNDADNEGALLAAPFGGYARNTILTPKILKQLQQQGVDRILVRSPLVGGSPDGGVYARDVGIRERGRMPLRGDYVGMQAAAALSEPITQSTLCLARGTMVRMSDGSAKPIDNINVGDIVLGADRLGRTFPSPVTAWFNSGVKTVYRTTFYSPWRTAQRSLDSTLEHKVLMRRSHGSFSQAPTEIIPIGTPGSMLAVVPAAMDEDGGGLMRGAPRLIGDVQTYDIEVDNPDHLFVLASGLIVSNSSKHSGGISGAAKAVSGFSAIDSLIQSPSHMKGGATHAEKDGLVDSIKEAPAGGWLVQVDGEDHYVPLGRDVVVKRGDRVEAGDVLSSGLPNPGTVVQHKGVGEGRRYFVDALRRTFADSGLRAHRRNLELLGRGLINHVRLTDEIGEYAPDDVVPYHLIERNYQPREGGRTLASDEAGGKYLERPYLHFSIGTKVRPSVAKELKAFNINSVDVHDDPPPFEPEMVRGMYTLQHDEDWMTRMYGSGMKGSVLEAARRGSTSNEAGTSFVPSLARTVDFGKVGPTRTVDYGKEAATVEPNWKGTPVPSGTTPHPTPTYSSPASPNPINPGPGINPTKTIDGTLTVTKGLKPMTPGFNKPIEPLAVPKVAAEDLFTPTFGQPAATQAPKTAPTFTQPAAPIAAAPTPAIKPPSLPTPAPAPQAPAASPTHPAVQWGQNMWQGAQTAWQGAKGLLNAAPLGQYAQQNPHAAGHLLNALSGKNPMLAMWMMSSMADPLGTKSWMPKTAPVEPETAPEVEPEVTQASQQEQPAVAVREPPPAPAAPPAAPVAPSAPIATQPMPQQPDDGMSHWAPPTAEAQPPAEVAAASGDEWWRPANLAQSMLPNYALGAALGPAKSLRALTAPAVARAALPAYGAYAALQTPVRLGQYALNPELAKAHDEANIRASEASPVSTAVSNMADPGGTLWRLHKGTEELSRAPAAIPEHTKGVERANMLHEAVTNKQRMLQDAIAAGDTGLADNLRAGISALQHSLGGG